MVLVMSEVLSLQNIVHDSDPLEYMLDNGARLMEDARKARDLSKHYKGFNVGTILIASTLEGEVREYAAGNRNVRPGQNDSKRCSEMRALKAALKDECVEIHGVVVSGPPQPDTQSHVVTPTLHCCGVCRRKMQKTKRVRPDALVVTVNPDVDVYEINSLAELDTYHQPGTSGVMEFSYFSDPAFKNWTRNVSGIFACREAVLTDGEFLAAVKMPATISF